MLKEFALLALVLTPISGACAQTHAEVPAIDDVDPSRETAVAAYENRERLKRDWATYVESVRTDDYYAGFLTTLTGFDGAQTVIDRTAETRKRTPGNTPPRLELIQGLLGNLSADARGKFQVRVEYNYYPDGSIKQEIYSIDVSGSWEAVTGKTDADEKNHR